MTAHLGTVISFIARLEAIRRALDYDITGYDPRLTGPAAILWRTNMAAWKLTAFE